MSRTGSRRTARTGSRTGRPSPSPHFMDDAAFTAAEILRERVLDALPGKH